MAAELDLQALLTVEAHRGEDSRVERQQLTDGRRLRHRIHEIEYRFTASEDGTSVYAIILLPSETSLRIEAFKEQDYNAFLLEELEKVRLEEGLQEELEASYARLNNAEQIIETLSGAVQLCQEEDYGLLALQARLRQLTSKLAQYGKGFEEVHQRILSLYIEADDIAQELQDMVSAQEADPGQLEAVGTQKRVVKAY